MTRYLLDSNAVNAFVDHRAPLAQKAREARLHGDRVGTCEPMIAELFFGLEFSSSRAENLLKLERALTRIACWPFDRGASRQYGHLAAELKRRGRPIQIFDMMLAAIALSLPNCVVVTTDSDLSAVPGLAVVNWML